MLGPLSTYTVQVKFRGLYLVSGQEKVKREGPPGLYRASKAASHSVCTSCIFPPPKSCKEATTSKGVCNPAAPFTMFSQSRSPGQKHEQVIVNVAQKVNLQDAGLSEKPSNLLRLCTPPHPSPRQGP